MAKPRPTAASDSLRSMRDGYERSLGLSRSPTTLCDRIKAAGDRIAPHKLLTVVKFANCAAVSIITPTLEPAMVTIGNDAGSEEIDIALTKLFAVNVPDGWKLKNIDSDESLAFLKSVKDRGNDAAA